MKTKVFQTFEEGFLKQNNLLKILLIALFIIVLLLGITLSTSRTFFLVKNRDTFRTELTIAEICHEAFVNINQGRLSGALLGSNLIKGIKEVNFRPNADIIYPPIVFSESQICKIIIRDKRGLRAFEGKIIKSPNYPLGIKLDMITEVHISQEIERYQ